VAGFVDLRIDPERIVEITEARISLRLQRFCCAEALDSPVWTANATVEPVSGVLAPILICCRGRRGLFRVAAGRRFLRRYVDRLNARPLLECVKLQVELVWAAVAAMRKVRLTAY